MTTTDGVVDAEIYQELTVSLTTSQVEWLREWMAADVIADTHPTPRWPAGDILRAVVEALPVPLTIELPAVATSWLEWGRTSHYPAETDIQLTPGEATALHLIRLQVRKWNADKF